MIHSILINLSDSRDRFSDAAAVLTRSGIAFEHLHAVDGRGGPPRTATGFGRLVSGSEQGCRASHEAALKAFLAGENQMVAVFEDDIAAIDSDGLASIAGWLSGQQDWGVAHLSHPVRGFRSHWGQAGCVDVYRAHLFPMTTGALLWSRDGAQAFLENAPEAWPMDHALRACLLRQRIGVGFDHAPVRVDNLPSQMTDRDALIDPTYSRHRAALRRRQKAVAAWNRIRWRFTGG